MKPESFAWLALQNHAASLLRPDFAGRTLRLARAVAPTLFSQCVLCVSTAAICLAVVFFISARKAADETARNLAGWQEIATEAEDLAQVR
jgi:hypothetical protein